MTTSLRPFFVIWNPHGSNPRFCHSSRDSADTEAKRLARENPGQSFYVLEAVGHARKADVIFTELKTGEQAPF